MQNSMNIIDKLREYQCNLYKENTMILKNLRFECRECHVHFTPGEKRARRLMSERGAINECRDCENKELS